MIKFYVLIRVLQRNKINMKKRQKERNRERFRLIIGIGSHGDEAEGLPFVSWRPQKLVVSFSPKA